MYCDYDFEIAWVRMKTDDPIDFFTLTNYFGKETLIYLSCCHFGEFGPKDTNQFPATRPMH